MSVLRYDNFSPKFMFINTVTLCRWVYNSSIFIICFKKCMHTHTHTHTHTTTYGCMNTDMYKYLHEIVIFKVIKT
jgi:hypothetical protein